MSARAEPVRLTPQTLSAFESYIEKAQRAMESCFQGTRPSLWPDLQPELRQRIREGKTSAEDWSNAGPTHVPDGLVHDWVGAAFVPGLTVGETLALIQNYENHKNIYKPEVIDSRLLSREGSDFRIFLRLRKKKVITVILDTYHDVHYAQADKNRWTCRSFTTSVLEVEHAGTAKEMVSADGAGYGYMWRLNSYWNFAGQNAGVWLECRAISLSRDIPKGLAWIIEPIVRKLPRESLVQTLQATRQALLANRKKANS